LNIDGTTTERKVRLSNIDVHETISDNVNINKDNMSNTTNFLDNDNKDRKYSNEIEKLRKSILDMINDITAFSMHDIMRPIKDSEEIITHVINVKPGAEPVKQKSRGIPHSFREEFKKTIHEMKDAGMIVDSSSPWCSPVRLVKKPDGSIRVCVDFRKVNNLTIKDAYPLPKIEDIFSKLVNGKYYTSLDLASGYYNVRMDKDSQKYTAFATQWGFFEYTRMAMGLCNSGATFSRLMAKVLDGYLDLFTLVYLDDILIYSNNLEDHYNHVKLVIERLRKHNLKVKLSKCKFAQTRIEYLSHIIEDGKISPNPAKVAAVANATRPKTVKQVQSFLGLVSYYRKFIKNCSTIMSPMIKLSQKDTDFIWTTECEDAFNKLKSYLIDENKVLTLPDFSKPFQIETDASKRGVGGVLSQKVGKHFQPVAYFSKHLSRTESNYSTSEREMLGIVLSVEHFKEYVYGRDIKIITDHEPLKFLSTADVPSSRLARLQKRLNIYNYTIEYRAGKLNGNADALSRMVDDDFEEAEEIEAPQESIIINAIHLKRQLSNKDQREDANICWIIDLMRNQSKRPKETEFANKERKSFYMQWDRLKIMNKILYREYRDQMDNVFYQYVVPLKQREFILKNNHDAAMCGHMGCEKTTDRMTHKFYWYKMNNDIEKYCQECVICQKTKISNKYNKTQLQPIFATRPGEIITSDIMGPLPISNGRFQYVLSVIDHFTKYVEFFPIESTTALESAQVILEYICRHGVPESILTDRGSNYQSELIQEL
jgi:hypothetical protein